MATALTYLQLVNEAIRQSRTSIDPLTTSNFASTTDPLQLDFKSWVNEAHREIQLERRKWRFKSKLANLLIGPRVYVEEEASGLVTPVATNIIRGDDTGAHLTVVSVSLISGAWNAGTAKAYITYNTRDGQFKFNETCDIVNASDVVQTSNLFRVKGWGRYNLQTEVSDLFEADLTTFAIQSTGGSSSQTNSSSFDPTPLNFIAWDNWVQSFENQEGAAYGCPQYFTITPEGLYDFYPRPDKFYVLRFYYQKSIQDLTLYTDTPTDLPADYHNAIVWRAVMYYADGDDKDMLWRKARRRFEFYKKRLEENQMPTPVWAPNPFYDRGN